eukprot:scaffold163506_cov71-Attheya_sp.AAC.2
MQQQPSMQDVRNGKMDETFFRDNMTKKQQQINYKVKVRSNASESSLTDTEESSNSSNVMAMMSAPAIA